MPTKKNEIIGESVFCELRQNGSMSVKDLRRHGSGKVGIILGITGAAACLADVILLAQGSPNQSIHEMGVIVGASGMLIGMGLIVYGAKKDTKKQASFDGHLMSLVREEEANLGRALTVEEKLQIGTKVFDM